MKRITIVAIILLLLIIIAIICYKCRRDQNPESCTNLIFVAVNRIPENDYNTWQIQNQDYMYNVPTREKKVGTGDGIVAIDASKIKESDYANWLKVNGNYIFYETTYPYIECAHNISESQITNVSPFTSVTLTKLKSMISANGGNFYATNYNLYTQLSISSNNVLTLSMTNTYAFNTNCFSVPLFRSIVDKYSLTNNNVIEFAKATVNKKKTIIFRVMDAGGLYNYYDYSQIPP